MIYSITFNPALDVSGVVTKLVPNEKTYVTHEKHLPGGNGINAGIIAHRLAAKVVLSGFLGGTIGDEIRELLDHEKVKHEFIQIEGRTRMNLTVANSQDHRQTRLSFMGPVIKASELKQLEEFLDRTSVHDVVILGGSLPRGIKTAQVIRIISELKKKGVRVIVDMPGENLKKVIKARPDFIKPNLTEFQQLVGRKVTSKKSILAAAQGLLRSIPLICVSSVEGGALLLTSQEVWFGKIPPVKIHSTVGAGDSMVGAMASLWSQKDEVLLEKLLRWGLAASCATLTEPGSDLGSKKMMLRYLSRVSVKQIR